MKLHARPDQGKVEVLLSGRVDAGLLAFAALIPAGCCCEDIATGDRPCLSCEAADVLREGGEAAGAPDSAGRP